MTMRVLVVGSGLAGLTAAWFLRANNCEVTVVDRAPGPGEETSFANGSLLTAALAGPWNSPGVLRVLLKSLGREDSPMLLRPRALPGMLRWGMAFLLNSKAARYQQSYLRSVRLAQYSQRMMREIQKEVALDFDHVECSTLSIFRDANALEAGIKTSEFLRQASVDYEVLNVAQLLKLQPALGPIAEKLCGAIAYPKEDVADARKFCSELRRACEDRGVVFQFDCEVLRFESRADRINSAVTKKGELVADAYLLAAASYSPALVKSLGVRLPVCPVKGYSITAPAGDWADRPAYPVLDSQLHAVVVPVGDRIRVAGTAEFAGFDREITQGRIDNLRTLLRRVYPEFEARLNESDVTAWTGLRPMTPDCLPIIGHSAIENLFVNTGHGSQGWTMACGCGRAVADVICGHEPGIDLTGLQYRN